jgi:NIMA (never in mitosis gene a)-related kinase
MPNVISYKGSFYVPESQSLCIVMEYADGGDLENKINQRSNINNLGF